MLALCPIDEVPKPQKDVYIPRPRPTRIINTDTVRRKEHMSNKFINPNGRLSDEALIIIGIILFFCIFDVKITLRT